LTGKRIKGTHGLVKDVAVWDGSHCAPDTETNCDHRNLENVMCRMPPYTRDMLPCIIRDDSFYRIPGTNRMLIQTLAKGIAVRPQE